MNEPSLLQIPAEKHLSDDTLHDLGMDDFFTVLENEKDAQGKSQTDRQVFGAFLSVLACPVTDKEELYRRRQTYQVFYEHPHLADTIIALCRQAPDCELKIKQPLYRTVTPDKRLAYNRDQTNRLLSLYETLGSLSVNVHAEGVMRVMGGLSLGELKNTLNEMQMTLFTQKMKTRLRFGDGMKLIEAELENDREIKKEKPASRFFRLPMKKAQEAPASSSGFCYAGNMVNQHMVCEYMDSVYLGCCSVYSQINHAFQQFFTDLFVAFSFFKTAVMIGQLLAQKHMPVNFPSFCKAGEEGISFREIYDPMLVLNGSDPVTKNDMCCRERLNFLVGPSQNGKSVLLRSIGMAQVFAQAGLPVAASAYRCPIFGGIVYHYPPDEDASLTNGRLANELTALKRGFAYLKNGGLLLMNDSFSSTTIREGVQLARDVLSVAAESGIQVFFATGLYEKNEVPRNIAAYPTEIWQAAPAVYRFTGNITEGEK